MRKRIKFILHCDSAIRIPEAGGETGIMEAHNVLGVYSSNKRATAKMRDYALQTALTLEDDPENPKCKTTESTDSVTVIKENENSSAKYVFSIKKMTEDQ